jgi:hypothetical protein
MPSTPSDDSSDDSSSKSTSKKAPIKDDDLPEIDVSSINVQMPF